MLVKRIAKDVTVEISLSWSELHNIRIEIERFMDIERIDYTRYITMVTLAQKVRDA